ncbi:hypothetical protein GCM10010361_14920 [Streptomyces olivaceiscleroticus]|uniref:Uncharacterized protein n=1 Tax=Streptomyces olivaceiscleroticus TaxID=68245 RepID=A0ABN0ZLF8_9ACTN
MPGPRRDRKDDPHALLSALHYLHQRAGSPSPWAIAVSSSHTLNQEAITAALEGSILLPWEDTQRLIHVLDGEPAYFEPLWQAAAHQPVTPHRSPPSPTQPCRCGTAAGKSRPSPCGHAAGGTTSRRTARTAPGPARTCRPVPGSPSSGCPDVTRGVQTAEWVRSREAAAMGQGWSSNWRPCMPRMFTSDDGTGR